MSNDRLGSIESSEKLIKEIYLDLREKLRYWSAVTQQTTQARMGYVGQHLVSIVTGYLGSKSGARGKDLIISETEYGEIKTCYKVDQLGKCNNCGKTVASIEQQCDSCSSTDIKRNDDSKWLISIRNNDEFNRIIDPKYYYLVLFEFLDIKGGEITDIQASIWQVDPKMPGFGLCMIDYYLNIRANSTSKAPFNFWPYSLKFDIMKSLLIYRSLIKQDNTIVTNIFPSVHSPQKHEVKSLPEYSQTRTLTKEVILKLGEKLEIALEASKTKGVLLSEVERFRRENNISDSVLSDALAEAIYLPAILPHRGSIPQNLKQYYPVLIS